MDDISDLVTKEEFLDKLNSVFFRTSTIRKSISSLEELTFQPLQRAVEAGEA
jgi:hypothetical protein